MLYGDGSGILGTFDQSNVAEEDSLHLDTVRNIIENLACKFVNEAKTAYVDNYGTITIQNINRANSTFSFNKYADDDYRGLSLATINGLNKELTGLGIIFDTTSDLYGVKRNNNYWMNPYIKDAVGELSEMAIQQAIDEIELQSGVEVDFISCSAPVRRAYQEALSAYRRNIDVMNLNGGFKALSYNGIPVVTDRFVEDNTMYILSTNEFELCQLCDWQWLENNDGRIIKQKEGYPVYTATLVKYAELLCNRPNSQAKLMGITVA